MNHEENRIVSLLDRRETKTNLKPWAHETIAAALAEQPDKRRAIGALATALHASARVLDSAYASTKFASLGHQPLAKADAKATAERQLARVRR